MFRALAIYLSVYLLFPPVVWSRALEAGASESQAKRAVSPSEAVATTASTSDERGPLRQAFQLASWKLAYVVSQKIPTLRKLRASEFSAALAPYTHCLPPIANPDVDLSTLDHTVLEPVQKALAHFLSERANELGTVSFPEGFDINDQPLVPPILSSETGVPCQPRASPTESPIPAGGKVSQLAALALAEARSFQEPFDVTLARFRQGPLSNLEVRGWIGWLASLREWRNVVARYEAIRLGWDSPPAAPPLKVSSYVGSKVAENFASEKSATAKILASAILSGKSVGEGLSELPRFSPCPGDSSRWCFVEGMRPVALDIEEHAVLTLHARKTPGTELDILRKMGIKAHMAQLAIVNSQLQNDAIPLEPSCREAGDLGLQVQFFDKLSTVDQKHYWALRFGEVVEKLERAYVEGTLSPPLPKNPRFFELAQTVIANWVEHYFRHHTVRLPSPEAGKVDPIEQKKQRLLEELATVPFSVRLNHASTGLGGGDFANLLAEKLRVAAVLIQEELGLIAAQQRRAVVEKMVEEALFYALVEALEAYGLAVAAEEQLDLRFFQKTWREQYRLQWENLLRSEELAAELAELSRSVVSQLLSTEDLNTPFNSAQVADEALTGYVRKIAPRVREAVQAEDTVRYMQSLVEWKNGPWNLLPGPWNYHWQLGGGLLGATYRSDSPAFFQMDNKGLEPLFTWYDADGHGYGYTMPLPDGRLPEGYVHLKGALRAVAERHRSDLIQRLRQRGYTDELVRRQFGVAAVRDTGVLADLVLRKFDEIVEANETSDRGQVAEARKNAYLPVLKWLQSAGAAAQYEASGQQFALRLYHTYLKGLLQVSSQDEKWRQALEQELDLIHRNETYLKRASVEEILKIYASYQERAREEQQSASQEKIKTEVRSLHREAVDKGLFERRGEGWFTFCAQDRKVCQSFIRHLAAPLRDAKKAYALYATRFQEAAERVFLDFLGSFGADHPRYDGTPPSDQSTQALLKTYRELLARAWVGQVADPKKIDWVSGKIDRLFVDLSQSSHATPHKAYELVARAVVQHALSIQGEMFEIWHQEMLERLSKLEQDALDAAPDTLRTRFADVLAVFGWEYRSLAEAQRLKWAEKMLRRELVQTLLPEYSVFRQAVSDKLSIVINPQPDSMTELARIEGEVRAKEDAIWSLSKKGKGDSKEVAELRQEIQKLEKFRPLLWEKRRAYLEVRRILEHYVPEVPAVKIALSQDSEQTQTDQLWKAYVTGQFLESKVDALGKPMLLSIGEVIEDLNQLAETASRLLEVPIERQRAFLKEAEAICRVGLSSAQKTAFERAYRQSLKAGLENLREPNRWFYHFWGIRPLALKALEPRLKRLWTASDRSEAAFEKWLGGLAIASTSAEKLNEHFDQFPGVEEFCRVLPKHSYHQKAQLLSDLFFHPDAPVAPLIDEKGAVHGFTLSPLEVSLEVSQGELGTLDRLKAVAPSDVEVTRTLVAFSKEPGVTDEVWRQIFGAPLASDRLGLLRSLSPVERRRHYESLRNFLLKKEALSVFSAKEEPVLAYDAWNERLRQLFLYWDSLKRELRQKTSALELSKHPEFGPLAFTLFRLFVSYTPYRLKQGRLAVTASPGAVFESIDEFERLTPAMQRRIVEDIEELYVAQTAAQHRARDSELSKRAKEQLSLGLAVHDLPNEPIQPFRKLFDSMPKAPGSTWMVTAEERRTGFFAAHFVVSDRSTLDVWREHYARRLSAGLRADNTEVVPFGFPLSPPMGQLSDYTDLLFSWVSGWEASAPDFSKFRKKDASRAHVWDLFPSITALKASGLFLQIKGVLTQLENVAQAPFVPKTFPYVLALLHWNTEIYGKESPLGPTPHAVPPTERLLGKLVGELVAVLGLDLRDPRAWEQVLIKKGIPEDWLLIAQSRRNLLVGAGDRRFLGTSVEAHSSINPNWAGGANYTYRPFPIVDVKERTSLATDLPFEQWFIKTQSPALTQSYRVMNGDEAKRPLFEQLTAVQNEMLGEKDLKEENTLSRARFNSNKGHWENYTFGNVMPSRERLEAISKRAELHSLAVNRGELNSLLATREALVDFRRTLGEINLRYAHESYRLIQGRGNDLPDSLQRRTFEGEVQAILKRFGQQMGASEPLPYYLSSGLVHTGRPRPDVAADRREVIGPAIYWASQLARKKAFSHARTPEERERLSKLLEIIDGYYTEEGQKLEVRRALKTVANNINAELREQCQASWVANLQTEEELRKAKDLVKKSKLIYFDNLAQILYFDSGWLEDGTESSTRRWLSEIARDEAEMKKFMDGVSTFVTWAVALTMLYLLFGRTSPGLAKGLAGNRLSQGILMVLAYGAALGFAGIEIYQIYEDFWGRPDEVELLTRVRDTQFTSGTPLMKDESAALVHSGATALREDQRSKLRWLFHAWGIVAGAQALTPLLRAARGGAQWLLQVKNPSSGLNQRYRPFAKILGLGRSKEPFEAVSGLTKEQARSRLDAAYQRVLMGKPGPGGKIWVDAEVAEVLRQDARKQLEQLCRELELNPETLLPWREFTPQLVPLPVVRSSEQLGTFWQRTWGKVRAFLWRDLKSFSPDQIRTRALSQARKNSEPRLKFLYELARHPAGQKKLMGGEDLVALVGVEADPIHRHTPFVLSLLGLSNWGPRVRWLRQVRAIAQAEIDIMALHDVQMLQLLVYFNQIGITGQVVEKWEVIAHRLGRRWTKMPAEVRRLFRSLQQDAHALTTSIEPSLILAHPEAVEREFARLSFFKQCFDEPLLGVAFDPRRAPLVEKYSRLIRTALDKYSPSVLHYYQQEYLRELGLGLEYTAREKMKTLERLALWHDRYGEVLADYARKKGVSDETVLHWMVNRDHPRYGEFQTPKRPTADEAPLAERERFVATQEPSAKPDIDSAAAELRAIMKEGSWVPDSGLIRAIARADYQAMAARLVVIRVTQGEMRGIDGNKPPELGEKDPLSEPELPAAEGPRVSAPSEKPMSPSELRQYLKEEFEKAVNAAIEKAERRAVEKGLSVDQVAAARQSTEQAARKRAEEYLESIDRYLAQLAELSGFRYDFELKVIGYHARLRVQDMHRFYDREIARFTGRESGAYEKEVLENLKRTAREELDQARQFVIEQAVKDAEKRGLSGKELQEIREAADVATREKMAKYLERVEASIQTEIDLRPTGGELDLRYSTLRNQLDLYVRDMARFYERELSGGRLLTRNEKLIAQVAAEKSLGVVADFEPMLKLISQSRQIPQEDVAEVFRLLLKRGNTRYLERELGVLRRLGKLSPDAIRQYRLAIAYNRSMELAQMMPTWAEREQLLRWMIERYLSKVDGVTAERMTVAEARELIGTPASRPWPSWENIEALAAARKAEGVDPVLVDAAVHTLRRAHPSFQDLGRLEDLALALDIPVEYIPSQLVAQALSRQAGIDSLAQQTFVRRYGGSVRETVEDAYLILGLSVSASDDMVAQRLRSLREELRATVERGADPGTVALHQQALDRLALAEKILSNRAQYPLKYRVPESVIPRLEGVEMDFLKDPHFQALVEKEGLDKALVEQLAAKSLEDARVDLFVSMATGQMEAAGLTDRERILRLMTASLWMKNARLWARVGDEAFERFVELALQHYVNARALRFSMTPYEAEKYIWHLFQRYGTAPRDLQRPERLKELWKVIVEEEAAIAAGKSTLSKAQWERLKEAALIVRLTTFPPGQMKFENMGLEALALLSQSAAPQELIVILIQEMAARPHLAGDLKRLVYQLLDSGVVRWGSDGTHAVGDTFFALFGAEKGELPRLVDSYQKAVIEAGLQFRLLTITDDVLRQTYEQALIRLRGEAMTRTTGSESVESYFFDLFQQLQAPRSSTLPVRNGPRGQAER